MKKVYCENCKYYRKTIDPESYDVITFLNDIVFTDIYRYKDFCIKNFHKKIEKTSFPIKLSKTTIVSVEDCHFKNYNNKCSDYKQKWWKFCKKEK